MQQSKQSAPRQQRSRATSGNQAGKRAMPTGPAAGILTLQQAAGNRAASRAITGRRARTPARLPDDLSPLVEPVIRGQGQPLEADTESEMAERFGQDFSQVRLHTGPAAGASAEALHARAYTVGSDIVFGAGRYVPGSDASQQLLAHELAHVVQQSRNGVRAPSLGEYGRAEGEARAAATQTGPVNVSQSVAAGTLQADSDEWYDTVATLALGPVAGSLVSDDAGSWILGAIGGEFVDDPTYGQIAVDFVLSVIPYVDQVADARDLIAHVFRLGFRGEHTKILRWVSLVFTLIGLIPELGSVVKSLSKAAIRFVGRNVGTIMGWIRRLGDLLPEAARGVDGIRRLIATHWDSWASFGRAIWNMLLSKGSELVGLITAKMRVVLPVPNVLISQGRRFLVNRLNDLRRISDVKLPAVIKNVKQEVLEKLDDLAERLGPRTATAGGPDVPVPHRAEAASEAGSTGAKQTTGGGGGGGSDGGTGGSGGSPRRRNVYPDFEDIPPAMQKVAREQAQRVSAQIGIKVPEDRILSAPWIGRIRNKAGEPRSVSTSQGWLRNESRFWTKWKSAFPEDAKLLGPGNTVTPGLAKKYGWPTSGKNSVVGQKLIHHHMANGPYTVAIPESLHKRLSGEIHATPTVVGE